MRLLLDTHVLLWWLTDDSLLPRRAGVLIADRRNQVFVSPMSVWEIVIKSQLSKLKADVDEVRGARPCILIATQAPKPASRRSIGKSRGPIHGAGLHQPH